MNLSEDIRSTLNASKASVFLDTVRSHEEERYSYLFSEPVDIITASSPDDVQAVHQRIEQALSEGFHVAGYWCYEWGYALIPKHRHLLGDYGKSRPLVWLGVYKDPRIWPSEEIQSPSVSSMHGEGETSDIKSPALLSSLKLDTGRDEYVQAIKKIKDFIKSGDTYQVNYTVRSRFRFNGAPLDLYERLRRRQAVSYGAVIHQDDRWILSLSPELFFHRRGNRIWTKPMKGTAARGSSLEEDRRIEAFLKNDLKNRAENVMIVDLLRNDLGRIAETGSVSVPKLFHVEKYATLFQMISRIEADVKHGTTWQEIFQSLFPCGSVTGAPKIRTMEIISYLENSPRGVYTGSIGFIAPDNRAVLNVAIRTLEIQGDEGVMGTGSGITISSDPVAEYDETRLKTKFLENA